MSASTTNVSVMAVFLTRFHIFKPRLFFLIIPLLLLFPTFFSYNPKIHSDRTQNFGILGNAQTSRKVLVIIEKAHVKIQLILPCTGSFVFSLRDTPRVLIASVPLVFVVKISHYLDILTI